MPWLQLRIDCAQDMAEALDQSLGNAGALAITMEDAGDQPLLEPGPGETPLWSELRITGLFDADIDENAVIAQLRTELGEQFPAAYRFEILEDKDWEREWMQNYQPIHCGNNLWICPNWIEPPQAEAVNLRLDPGLAFGTGTHPTTRLCLDWLAAHPPQQQVIDYGCGSGILGIAALLLGAQHCLGVDNDPQALLASRNNARNNNLPDSQFSVYSPQGLPESARAELVLANILYGPLISLRDTLCHHLNSGGYLVLSGILNEQAESLCDHYSELLSIEAVESLQDWSRVVARKV